METETKSNSTTLCTYLHEGLISCNQVIFIAVYHCLVKESWKLFSYNICQLTDSQTKHNNNNNNINYSTLYAPINYSLNARFFILN